MTSLVFKRSLVSRLETTAKFFKGVVEGNGKKPGEVLNKKPLENNHVKAITLRHSYIFLITALPNICHHKIHLLISVFFI